MLELHLDTLSAAVHVDRITSSIRSVGGSRMLREADLDIGDNLRTQKRVPNLTRYVTIG